MKLGFVATYASVSTMLAGISVAATGYLEPGVLLGGLGVIGATGRALVGGMLEAGQGQADSGGEAGA